jgi:hypothetical protein
MAITVRVYTSFNDMWNWKGIREKAGKVNSAKVYITNDENSVEFSVDITRFFANTKLIYVKDIIYNRDTLQYCHVLLDTDFGLIIGFIEHL